MRNESAGERQHQLPYELVPDFEEFKAALSPWLEPFALHSNPPMNPELLLERLRHYGILLHAKSAQLSLISKGDRTHLFTRHILDSLNPVSLFEGPPRSALDIGSGGGLPGVPLAIAWPGTRMILLESRERKAGFLEQMVRELRLDNARVACARLEDFGVSWREGPIAAVFVRAIGGLPAILHEASKAAESGARWVYFLGARDAAAAMGPESLDAGRCGVTSGAFGGRLLTGRLGPP